MRVERLMTLSGFIDQIKQTKYELTMDEDIETFFISNLGLIYRYNEFLKGKVDVSMFTSSWGKCTVGIIELKDIEMDSFLNLHHLAEATEGMITLKAIKL